MSAKGERWNWPQRFWAKVDKSAACWRWTGTIQNCGYGQVWLDGRMQLAHRVAYEETVGPLGDLTTDHLCGIRSCVRPDHLEAVPFATNVARSNNPTAINGRKIACPNGHAYRTIKSGKHAGERYCPSCRKERQQAA